MSSTPVATGGVTASRALLTTGRVLAGVLALTIVTALVAVVFPSLAPAQAPHPTLHGTPGEVASILGHNLRVLAVPIVLVAGRWTVGRSRVLGDVVLVVLAGGNVAAVGFALGRHRDELLPYLPHVPLEWAALSVSLSCWVAHRGLRAPIRAVVPYAGAAVCLAALAAVIEVYAVPHP